MQHLASCFILANLHWSPETEEMKGNSLVQSGLNLVLYFAAPENLLNFAFLVLGGETVPSTSKQESSQESESA